MRHEVFSIFDLKAGLYGLPFFMQNQALATRSFHQLATDLGSSVAHYPGDFELRGIGVFDDVTGELVSIDPVTIVSATAVVAAFLPVATGPVKGSKGA